MPRGKPVSGHAPGVSASPLPDDPAQGCYPGAMHGLALALLLVAATIDPRLTEPLRLLTELPTVDATGQPIGPYYAGLPDTLHLTLAVAVLPRRVGGSYSSATRTVTMAEALLAEDPRVVATGLVHELRHARDGDLIAVGDL